MPEVLRPLCCACRQGVRHRRCCWRAPADPAAYQQVDLSAQQVPPKPRSEVKVYTVEFLQSFSEKCTRLPDGLSGSIVIEAAAISAGRPPAPTPQASLLGRTQVQQLSHPARLRLVVVQAPEAVPDERDWRARQAPSASGAAQPSAQAGPGPKSGGQAQPAAGQEAAAKPAPGSAAAAAGGAAAAARAGSGQVSKSLQALGQYTRRQQAEVLCGVCSWRGQRP